MSPKILNKRLIEKDKTFTSKTGVEVEQSYCRKCMKMKLPLRFYTATDLWLDSNGLMSICKDCCNEIFKKFEQTEQSTERAILRMCRLLNIKYDERAIQSMYKDAESRKNNNDGKEIEGMFGLYKMALSTLANTSIKNRNRDIGEDLTFVEPNLEVKANLGADLIADRGYFEESWGKGLNEEDYSYMESEFSKWKRTTKCDTQSEEILVRELCHKQNEIRKSRIEGKSVDGLVKSLQEIMKNSALTPALQNAASSGKNADCFGMWVKDIENLSPAEWHEQQDKFKDMDGLEQDRDDIRRSIASFITGSRDYTTTELEEISDLDISDSDDGG